VQARHRFQSSHALLRSVAGPDRGNPALARRPLAARAGSIAAAGALLGIASAPTIALAHAGHGVDAAVGFAGSLAAGLVHPFSGFDHLLAMLAVGAWGTHVARRAWVVPAPCVVALLVGFALASVVSALPGIEVGVAASLLVLGGLLLGRIAPRTARRAAPGPAPRTGSAGSWAPALVGACTLLHGVAHGQAFAGVAPFVATASGLALGSALIVAAGALAARGTDRAWAPRFIGATAAVVGAVSFVGLTA
jgi:urease accessory protein